MTERLQQLAQDIKDVQLSQKDEIMKKILVFKLIREAKLTAQGYVILNDLLQTIQQREK